MTKREDGGPAFPLCSAAVRAATEALEEIPAGKQRDMLVDRFTDRAGGMSLRDYAAIHSTQPGIAEICKCAGIGFDGIRVYLTADDSAGQRFDDWWRSLSIERMCELSAMVRYAQADGMLKARSA
jgi:hypothetical protein